MVRYKVFVMSCAFFIDMHMNRVHDAYEVVENGIPELSVIVDVKISGGLLYFVIESPDFDEVPVADDVTTYPQITPVVKVLDWIPKAGVEHVEPEGTTEEFVGDQNILENKLRNSPMFTEHVKKSALSIVSGMKAGDDIGSVLVNEEGGGRTGMISWLISDKQSILKEDAPELS